MKAGGVLVFAGLLGGCVGAVASLYPPARNEASVPVWVVRHAWHTGIVVRREDIPPGAWPENDDFPAADFLEIGWGDRRFYQAARGTLGLALRAALWPTDSALHVAAFRQPPRDHFAGREVLEVGLSTRGFERLAVFIGQSHARDASGRAILLGPGKDGESRFYLGLEPYVLTTCNVWTARALRMAGLPVTPAWALSASSVMFQVRRAVRSSAEPP